MERPKIALVLSTGGARGISFIGVIEELEKHGFEITSVAGCSMGALIGVAYITGKMEECKNILCSLTKLKMLSLLDPSVRNKGGMIKGAKLMGLLKKHLPDISIEDLPIPFTVVATDIQNESEVVIENGKIYDAIRASISMPGVFNPVRTGNKTLIDGGLINPLPLNRVKRNKNDLLVGVVAGASDMNKNTTAADTFSSILTKSSTLMVQTIIGYAIDKYQPDMVISVPGSRYSVTQFYKASELIELGRETARDYLKNYDRNVSKK